MSPFLVLAALFFSTDLVRVDLPLAVDVPATEVESYLRGEPVSAGEWPSGPPFFPEVPGAASLPPGRVDLLEARPGAWRWMASAPSRGEEGSTVPLGPGQALLQRSAAAPGRWGWADGSDSGAGMKTFRTIEVTTGSPTGSVVAFAPGRPDRLPSERSGPVGSNFRIPFVPPGPALVCWFTAEGDACRVAAPQDRALARTADPGPARQDLSPRP